MKKIILMLSIVAFVFSGSKKKEAPAPGTGNNPTATPGVLVCKVNGNDWQSDPSSKPAQFIDEPMSSTEVLVEADSISIIGIRVKGTDTSCIAMYFYLTPGRTGVYTLTGMEHYAFYMAGTTLDALFTAAFDYTRTATVELTKFDTAGKKISGKFNFSMTNNDPSKSNIMVTEGSFTDLSFK